MSSTLQHKLERRIALLISKIARLGLQVKEFVSITQYLLTLLQEITDQPTHSRFYLEEKEKQVRRVERTYGLSNERSRPVSTQTTK